MIDERLLQGVEAAVDRDAFDGGDLFALAGNGERQTGEYSLTIEQHCTCAALPVVAPLFGAGQRQALAQGVEERDPRLDLERVLRAIDTQVDRRQQ
jgi:hypothetical protein